MPIHAFDCMQGSKVELQPIPTKSFALIPVSYKMLQARKANEIMLGAEYANIPLESFSSYTEDFVNRVHRTKILAIVWK